MATKAVSGNTMASQTLAAVDGEASSRKTVPAKPMAREVMTAPMTTGSVSRVEGASSVAPTSVASTSVASTSVASTSVASSSMAPTSAKRWRTERDAQRAQHNAHC